MTIQNIIDSCGQRKRDLDELASRFALVDPATEVAETGVALVVAIGDAVTAANQADLTTYTG